MNQIEEAFYYYIYRRKHFFYFFIEFFPIKRVWVFYSSFALAFLLARTGLLTSEACDSKGSGILETMSFKKSNLSTVSIVFFL
jgi:hypothetical protein